MEEGTEPDGGWGWIIVFSTHVAFLLNTGFYASMGVFFVALLNYFEESATSTSVVIAISGATAAIAGPVAGYFVRKFGERLTMLAGGIVGTIGLIANTFAPSLEFMYFSHGVLLGVAAGVSSVASTSILSSYFRKRHALASSIAYTGASVGIMVIPPLGQFLIDMYGWRGAMLIFAGIYTNIFVSTALIKPLAHTRSNSNSPGKNHQIICTRFCEVFGFHLLRKYPTLNLFLVSQLLLGYCIQANLMYMISLAINHGVPALNASSLMSILGFSVIVGRLAHGWVVDKRFISPLNVLAISMGFYGAFTYMLAACESYICMAVSCAGLGPCQGIFIPISAVVIKDMVEPNDFAGMFGLSMLFMGIGETVALPLSGLVYDTVHSFNPIYFISGSLMMLATILLIILSVGRKWCCLSDHHDDENTHSGEEETENINLD